MDLHDILELEQHGPDTFVGTGPRYPWGGLYGGQIVAQALRAALHTVEPTVHPHSLRAYFIRSGDQDEPVRYEVDRLRNGRSFTTRRVVARQAVGAILNLEASFTAGDDSVTRQRVVMPVVPGPEGLEPASWSDRFERRPVPVAPGSGVLHLWLRCAADVCDDPVTQQTAFAYLSDDAPSDAIRALLTEPGGDMADFDQRHFVVSLDHTVWFHAPMQPDEWHLHSFSCDRVVAGRALTHGRIFARDGTHTATIAQEMLVRTRR